MIGLRYHARERARRAAAFAVLWVATLTACSKQNAKPQRPPVPVTVTAARRAAVPYTVEANGVVTPFQTAMVAPQVDGIIRQVSFKEGQDVSSGQVLFQIEPRPYQAAYEQAKATLARDRATADNARREVERYSQLVKKDYVTQEQADQQRATASSAAATVQADEAAVANAKFNLDNTIIRAPISGRTGGLLVRAGNLVRGSAATPLVLINQIRPILVRFAVPGTELPLIQQYGAQGGLPVTAVPGANPAQAEADTSAGGGPPGTEGPPNAGGAEESGGGDPIVRGGARGGATPQQQSDVPAAQRVNFKTNAGVQGTLSFIDNAVDTTTGTVMLKATFANTAGSLWPGEFVAVSMRLYVEQNALVVPTPAVVTGQQGTYVYVIDSTGAARQRPVIVKRTAGNVSVIASGLKSGERVVTDGQSRLTPGAKVIVRVASSGGTPGNAPDSSTRTSAVPRHSGSATTAATPSATSASAPSRSARRGGHP